MRYLEGKFIRSKVIIKILRRKYEKRENFLIEMESILKATKIKLDCTREIKRMLQVGLFSFFIRSFTLCKFYVPFKYAYCRFIYVVCPLVMLFIISIENSIS